MHTTFHIILGTLGKFKAMEIIFLSPILSSDLYIATSYIFQVHAPIISRSSFPPPILRFINVSNVERHGDWWGWKCLFNDMFLLFSVLLVHYFAAFSELRSGTRKQTRLFCNFSDNISSTFKDAFHCNLLSVHTTPLFSVQSVISYKSMLQIDIRFKSRKANNYSLH